MMMAMVVALVWNAGLGISQASAASSVASIRWQVEWYVFASAERTILH